MQRQKLLSQILSRISETALLKKIDTGGAKPVCCRKPSYGPYESKVILTQVAQLLSNGWIEPCEGPWGGYGCSCPEATPRECN